MDLWNGCVCAWGGDWIWMQSRAMIKMKEGEGQVWGGWEDQEGQRVMGEGHGAPGSNEGVVRRGSRTMTVRRGRGVCVGPGELWGDQGKVVMGVGEVGERPKSSWSRKGTGEREQGCELGAWPGVSS